MLQIEARHLSDSSPAPGPAPSSPLVDDTERIEGGDESRWLQRGQLLEQGMPASATNGAMPLHVDDLLRYAVSVGASDLHLTAADARDHPSARGHSSDRRLPGARSTRPFGT